jgi:biopolymer transport protein TolQ
MYLFASGVFVQAFVLSDFFGKLIFISLFALSFVTWLILLQKILLFRNVKRAANKLQDLIFEQNTPVLSVPMEKFNSLNQHEPINPFGKIYLSLKNKTIEILDKNHFFHQTNTPGSAPAVFLSRADVELLEVQGLSTITEEAKNLEKNLFILSTAVTLAPFLGILGTVWGILLSLAELQKGGAVHSNSILLGGLSTALATTVLGLVIAIPALVSYNYLRNALARFYGEMENFGNIILSTIELQYRKVDPL